jgi:biotin synthase
VRSSLTRVGGGLKEESLVTKTLQELQTIYHRPFFDLLAAGRAATVAHWPDHQMQLCTLLSVKTGGCSEDCGYCSQSAHHATDVPSSPLMTVDEVLPHALRAKENGSTRFCMGAAWRGVRDGEKKFEVMLETVRAVSRLGMEVCVTLGQLSETEARKLREAGLTAYNHNIDTSPEHYKTIVSTHSFEDRLGTIGAVQRAGLHVCCGGILGMGESVDDRLRMLEVLCGFDPPPESVPINCLMPVAGTPLQDAEPVDFFDLVRMIATARVALPISKIRLSAGRTELTREAQALCFFAGANSIFFGEKLLTAGNPSVHEDLDLLRSLDLSPLPPFRDGFSVPRPANP